MKKERGRSAKREKYTNVFRRQKRNGETLKMRTYKKGEGERERESERKNERWVRKRFFGNSARCLPRMGFILPTITKLSKYRTKRL